MKDDALERAMDFDEVKETSPVRKAEIEEQLSIAKKTMMLREKEIYKAIAMFAIHGDD